MWPQVTSRRCVLIIWPPVAANGQARQYRQQWVFPGQFANRFASKALRESLHMPSLSICVERDFEHYLTPRQMNFGLIFNLARIFRLCTTKMTFIPSALLPIQLARKHAAQRTILCSYIVYSTTSLRRPCAIGSPFTKSLREHGEWISPCI